MTLGFWTNYDSSILQEVQHPDGKRDAEEYTQTQSEYFQINVCVVPCQPTLISRLRAML